MKPSSLAATQKKRQKQLLENISSDDIIGIMINADPDAMASALALQRIFWREVKHTIICRVNAIKRSDNLAMIKLLGLQIPYANRVDISKVTKWAIVDGQPHHHSRFAKVKFDIIIDHHPRQKTLRLPLSIFETTTEPLHQCLPNTCVPVLLSLQPDWRPPCFTESKPILIILPVPQALTT